MLQVELPAEAGVEQLQRLLRCELGRPQLVIRRHHERRVVAVGHAVRVIDRLKERDRLPAAPRVGIPLLAHLEREHEVQLRQPRLAGAFPRQQHRPPRLHCRADLRRERAETAHPVVPAPDRVSVCRVPAHQRLDRLVHVDPVDTVAVQHGVRDAGVLGAPERCGHVHGGARLRVEDVVDLLAHAAVPLLNRPGRGALGGPARRAGAPQPLVHVDHRVAAGRVGRRQRRTE